jgi:hypothetical protein
LGTRRDLYRARYRPAMQVDLDLNADLLEL